MRVEEIHSVLGIQGVQLFVFKVVNEFTERDGEYAMGYKYMAQRTGFTEKEVRGALFALYQMKLIDRREGDIFIHGNRVRAMQYWTYPIDYYKSKGIFA